MAIIFTVWSQQMLNRKVMYLIFSVNFFLMTTGYRRYKQQPYLICSNIWRISFQKNTIWKIKHCLNDGLTGFWGYKRSTTFRLLASSINEKRDNCPFFDA